MGWWREEKEASKKILGLLWNSGKLLKCILNLSSLPDEKKWTMLAKIDEIFDYFKIKEEAIKMDEEQMPKEISRYFNDILKEFNEHAI